MAMTKAELAEHRNKYVNLMKKSREAESSGLYRDAVTHALESWGHIDGMMQYERRFNNREFSSVEGIDMILKYAPLLFDYPNLDMLELLLKERRRIEKNTTQNLGEKLEKARQRMWEAHRLWSYLEQNPETEQDKLCQVLGGNKNTWRSMIDMWESMGLVCLEQEGDKTKLSLATRMGKVVPGKCSACGTLAEAPKAMFLNELNCSECGSKVMFVILDVRDVNKSGDK